MVYSSMIIYMAVTMITPGPNNLTMLFLGAKYGFSGTRKFFIASAICLCIKTLLCGGLNVGLAQFIPIIVKYLKWVGAAYMLYLGYTMARSGWQDTDEPSDAKDNSTDSTSDNSTVRPRKVSAAQQTESTYSAGIILQLLNMKSWVTCLGLYAAYVVPITTSFVTVVWVALLYTVFMIVSSCCWGFFGSAMRHFIARYKKPFGILMGLSLLYCAITAVL